MSPHSLDHTTFKISKIAFLGYDYRDSDSTAYYTAPKVSFWNVGGNTSGPIIVFHVFEKLDPQSGLCQNWLPAYSVAGSS